jgi:hypothetical protein
VAEDNHPVPSQPPGVLRKHLDTKQLWLALHLQGILEMRKYLLILGVSIASTLTAQDSSPQQPSMNWHKFGESRPADPPPLPTEVRLPAGAWITIRVNQPLSSDRNRAGDAFTATLVQPLVADGMVIARRGQTVAGRVAEARKAGRAKGTSRLGIEITDVSLVDGQQFPVKTQLMERRGDTSVGRDVGAIGVTAGTGAAIGAGVAGPFGAGVGALAGAFVSTIGVLVTRGKPTVVYPETVLTFRLESQLKVSIARSGAFRLARREDYIQPALYPRSPPRLLPPPPYYGGYYYPPYYWGPGFVFYGRGFYRRW